MTKYGRVSCRYVVFLVVLFLRSAPVLHPPPPHLIVLLGAAVSYSLPPPILSKFQ